MNPRSTLWREAFAEFERLSELDAPVQRSEMDAIARARPDLHPLISRMFLADAYAESAEFLGAPARVEAPTPVSGWKPGDQVGPYRLERAIGSGGMGEVWLARRADGLYDTPVALKLLHAHFVRSGVRGRFLREGRILGRLSHPHIAHLLDAGVTESGQLFLAIEHVEGEPLDTWCEQQGLSVEARLRLMLQVCDAVAHAHAQLIVHRDLKPSNILVGKSGEVKLLDFGIAKLVTTEDTARELTELTQVGSRVFTPQYAAPEQVAGKPVTVATDVYALGVLLYSLLSGQRPYGHTAQTLPDLEREVLETEPPPPSRATASKKLGAALAGDLDTIVLKALKKDPAERYASVTALAEDLRRHLDHRPVLARPDAFGYRARKYVRRHRVAVATSALVAVALLAGTAVALWQAQIAREQARLAQAQSQRAERVKEFVVSAFHEQNPFERSTAAARSPHQMLAEAVRRLDHDFEDDPGLHAELLGDFGTLTFDFGDYEGGLALLERAVAKRSAQHGPDSPQVAEALLRLSGAINRRDNAKAAEHARRALDILRATPQADPAQLARAQTLLAASISFGKGAPAEAEALLVDALRVSEAHLGRDHPETLRVLYELTRIQLQSLVAAKAEPRAKDLLERTRRRYGPDAAAVASALSLVGEMHSLRNEPAAALDHYQQAATILQARVGPQNSLLAAVLSYVGMQLRSLRRNDEAFQAYAAAMAALPDTDVSNRFNILRGYGRAALDAGRVDEGEALLRQGYELIRGKAGDGNGFTWYLASEWGRGLAAQGRLEQAESIQREAMEKLAALMGPDAFQNVLLMEALALTLERKPGGHAEAEQLWRKALDLTGKLQGPQSAEWTKYALDLARILERAQTPAATAEGIEITARAVANCRADANVDRHLFAEILVVQATFLARADRRGDARTAASEAVGLLERTDNPEPALVDRARRLVASTAAKT